ncbi:MAG: 3-deoxy-manno-octulosonate cytidylyltransferase [Rickettsiaceae bacterium]
MYSDIAVIIPSRIGSTRLHRKALAKIGDKCLIEHVIFSLKTSFDGALYVATDSEEIAGVVKKSGAIAIMTDENCPTGSDRTFQAFQKISKRDRIKYIINIQGDMPFINPVVINKIIAKLKKHDCDIVTPVVKVGKDIAISESNVKVVADNDWNALYFSRSLIPHGGNDFLYHVGIYGFQATALEKFVKLPQGKYEACEKLEQLRALENGMRISVCLSDEIPISVDTAADLEKAVSYYKTRVL